MANEEPRRQPGGADAVSDTKGHDAVHVVCIKAHGLQTACAVGFTGGVSCALLHVRACHRLLDGLVHIPHTHHSASRFAAVQLCPAISRVEKWMLSKG